MMRAMLFALILLLAGCSVSADTRLAEAKVADFHRQLDAGAFSALYDGSADDLKAASRKADFVKLLDAVHRKLGPFREGKTAGWNVNATTGGRFVTIDYQARYARGAAEETFIFRLNGDRALLTGYNINSQALILN